jgi:hypothetical protein
MAYKTPNLAVWETGWLLREATEMTGESISRRGPAAHVFRQFVCERAALMHRV